MKITRRQLRKIIKEVINPEGNAFSAAAAQGDVKRDEGRKDELARDFQETVDWFNYQILPALRAGFAKGDPPIIVDKDYVWGIGSSRPEFAPGPDFKSYIRKGQKIGYEQLVLGDTVILGNTRDGNSKQYADLAWLYDQVEKEIIKLGLSVTIESDVSEELNKKTTDKDGDR